MTGAESRFVAVEVEDVDVAQADRYERGDRDGWFGPCARRIWDRNSSGAPVSTTFSYFYSFPLTSLQDLDPDTGVIQQRFQRLSASVDPDAADAFSIATARAVQGDAIVHTGARGGVYLRGAELRR